MKPSRALGQSLLEYLVILSLVSVVLLAGPRSPLQMLFEAAGARYERFTSDASQP